MLLLIDFNGEISETGGVLSLNKFIRGWCREKEAIKTIKSANQNIFFLFDIFLLFKSVSPYMKNTSLYKITYFEAHVKEKTLVGREVAKLALA